MITDRNGILDVSRQRQRAELLQTSDRDVVEHKFVEEPEKHSTIPNVIVTKNYDLNCIITRFGENREVWE